MTHSEILSLEDPVLMPRKLKSFQNIPKGLLQLDRNYRAYSEAGGKPVDFSRKTCCRMRLLPQATRGYVFMKFDDFPDNPMALSKWFKEKTKLICHCEDSDSKVKPTHVLDDDEGDRGSAVRVTTRTTKI